MPHHAEGFTVASVFILSIVEVFSTMTQSSSGDKNEPYRDLEKRTRTKVAATFEKDLEREIDTSNPLISQESIEKFVTGGKPVMIPF